MQLSPEHFINFMGKKGFYTDQQIIPELNLLVWKNFLMLTAKNIPEINAAPIYCAADKYGFFYNPHGDCLSLEWALCSYFCHSHLPYALSEIITDMPRILEELHSFSASIVIKTDTFIANLPNETNHSDLHHVLWLNSPIVKIPENFSDYLASLTSSRRNKIKKVITDFSAQPITVVFGHVPLNESEINFAEQNLTVKWGEDMSYAYAQLLWSLAVALVMPQQVVWLRVYYAGKLMAISHYIVKENILYHQGIVKDEQLAINNIGTYCFLETIKELCGKKYLAIDPTCKTSFVETESIDFYKRSVVNYDAVKAVLLAVGKEGSKNWDAASVPFYSAVDGWNMGNDRVVLMRGI